MKRTWIFIVVFLFSISTTVAAIQSKEQTPQTWKDAIAESGVLFAKWKNAPIRLLLSESDNQQDPVRVWAVGKENENLGYFVTANHGQTLLEYSPITPVLMQVVRKHGTYMYAGPGMHLYRADKQDEWVNLSNGETLPKGNPMKRLAAESADTMGNNMPEIKRSKPSYTAYSTDTQSDHGIAVMIQHSLGQSVLFDLTLLPEEGVSAGYLVYNVLPKDYYSVWAIEGLQFLSGGKPFLEVKDVFSHAEFPIYICADAPVNWVGSK